MAGNFALSFSLNFLSIFEPISGSIIMITLILASLERSFSPPKLSLDDANFGQKWWCQKWKKGWGLTWPVTAGTGVSGLNYALHDVQNVCAQTKGGTASITDFLNFRVIKWIIRHKQWCNGYHCQNSNWSEHRLLSFTGWNLYGVLVFLQSNST